MLIKREALCYVLDKLQVAPAQFGDKINVEAEEVFNMLEGKRVSVETARNLIGFLKADYAQHLIDWDKLGIQNPLDKKNRKGEGF